MELMNSKVKLLKHIPAVPKRERVLTRLGYKSGTTMLDSRHLSALDRGIHYGGVLCRPAGAYVSFNIIEKSCCSIKLENCVEFQSQSLLRLLKDSSEIVFMASTVGREVVEKISDEIERGDAAAGLILDAVASQTADAVLDWMMDFLNKMLAREGRRLTKHRYSPGYGDLPLVYQKTIFQTLMLERLDMELTEKFMLVPEKSVIAIAGIEEKRS